MILAVLGSYIDGSGVEQTVRISSAPYRDDTLGDFEPRIVEGSDPEYRSRIAFDVWGEQQTSTNYGAIEVINIDGSLDSWIDGQFVDRYWEVRYGDPDLPWDDLTLHYRARVKGVSFARMDRVIIECHSSADRLQGAIQVNTFSASTPNPDVRENRMPMMIGVPEHVPTTLLDEDHPNGQRYFVADNFNGVRRHSGDRAGCKEGLATIPIVTAPAGAGEAQLWRRGFDINRNVTLPQTALQPLGPRKRLIPWLDAHFARWENDLPAGSWTYINVSTPGEFYATQYGNLDALYIETELDAGSYTALRYPDVLEAGKGYTLRLHLMHVEGLTNRCELQLMSRDIDMGGASAMVNRQDVEWDDDTSAAQRMRVLEFDFEHNNDPGQTMLEIRFRRHSQETLSTLVCLRIQLLPQVESGAYEGGVDPPAEIMTKLHDLLPYLALERGVKNVDGLPPDFEQGPLHPTQLDYPAIEQVSNEYPNTHLAWWWDDGLTHQQLFNRMMSTMNASMRFDREDKLTMASLRAPEYFTGDAATQAPVWDVAGQKTAVGNEATLTIAAPDDVLPGDLVMLVTLSSADITNSVNPAPIVEGFSVAANVIVLAEYPNQIMIPDQALVTTVQFKVSDGDEPAAYVAQVYVEGQIALAVAARVSGALGDNPFGITATAKQQTGHQLAVGGGPGEDIERNHSLLVSVGAGFSIDGELTTGDDPRIAMAVGPEMGPPFGRTVLAVAAGERNPGDGNREGFTGAGFGAYVHSAISIAINPAMPAEADIFTDRFQLAGDRLDVAPDNAVGLSDYIAFRKNFRPMGEGEMAEAAVPPGIRNTYRKEWLSIQGARPNIDLPPNYKHAIGAPPIESMEVSTIRPQSVLTSRLLTYGIPRRWWQYTHLGSDVPAEPGRPGHLTFPRYQLGGGKQLIITDVRHLPLSGRQELICWG